VSYRKVFDRASKSSRGVPSPLTGAPFAETASGLIEIRVKV